MATAVNSTASLAPGKGGMVEIDGMLCLVTRASAVFGEGWGGEEGGAPSSSPPTPETASFAPKPTRSAARRGRRLVYFCCV